MSRTVPGGARPEWPDDPEHGYGPGRGGTRNAPGNAHGYDGGRGALGGQAGYGQAQQAQSQQHGQYGWPQSYNGQEHNGQSPNAPYDGYGYGAQENGAQENGAGVGSGQGHGYDVRRSRPQSAVGKGLPRRYPDGGGRADTRRYETPGQYDDTQRVGVPWQQDARRQTGGRHYQEPGSGPRPGLGTRPGAGAGLRPGQGSGHGPGRRPARRPPARRGRFRRIRRLYRRRYVRLATAIVAVFAIFVLFSAGQATFKNNGQGMAANLAEWARDHGLGPIVTFGEYLTYNPPPKGGKPGFSLVVPKGEQVTANKKKAKKGFQPDIPATLKSLAGAPIQGEGQWRLVEKVHGHPAIFTTFLRDATYTSQVNGIASMDQRLVKFQMHPGSEDPGPGNWGKWGADYIASGHRKGLLATFNGGFKLASAMGGFYLNGHYHGALVSGAASVVYYKNGTIKIGTWGKELKMTPQVEGVRQNLKLLIDHGKIEPNLNQNIETKFGATLGGGYYVWRSGLGITKDGRIIYVYGPALDVQDLADLLQRAGAIEGMQMDINPYWMKYEYYTVKGGNVADPVPTNLLPTQQQSAYTYYSPYTRDFTAVYAR